MHAENVIGGRAVPEPDGSLSAPPSPVAAIGGFDWKGEGGVEGGMGKGWERKSETGKKERSTVLNMSLS